MAHAAAGDEAAARLESALGDTVAACVDALIDAFASAPDTTHWPAPRAIDLPPPVPQPAVLNGLDEPTLLDPDAEQWCLILWNDEVHSYSEVVSALRRLYNYEPKVGARYAAGRAAELVTVQIDDIGRVVLACTRYDLACALAKPLATIKLGVSVRAERDVRREVAAALGMQWVRSLVNAAVPSTADAANDDAVSDAPAIAAATAIEAVARVRRIACEQLYEPHQSALVSSRFVDDKEPTIRTLMEKVATLETALLATATSVPPVPVPVDANARLVHLFYLDHKAWKQLRALFVEIYVCAALVVDSANKRRFAHTFAHAYVRLMANFVHFEREKDANVLHFAVQLFTTPSVALDLVKAGFYFKCLAVLGALFGFDSLVAADRQVGYAHEQLDISQRVFRKHDYYTVLHHLRYLLQAEPVQTYIRDEPAYLDAFIELATHFHGLCPETRQTGAHVEFESTVWAETLQVNLHLLEPATNLLKAYRGSEDAMTRAARAILDAYSTYDTHVVEPYGSLPMFSVLRQPVTVHNILHFMLAQLEPTPSWLTKQFDATQAMNLLDPSLRALVFCAQVQAGLWVRNGDPVRTLAHYYALNPAFRDKLYERDLVLVRLGLAAIPVTQAVPWLLDRFGWLPGHVDPQLRPDGPDAVEEKHRIEYLEESLLALITVVTDMGATEPVNDQTRRALVHRLALRPMPYSELTRNLPAAIRDNVDLEPILRGVASFVTQSGATVAIENDDDDDDETGGISGKYHLKPDLRRDVNPYYKYYARNDRVAAEEMLSKEAGAHKPAVNVPVELRVALYHPALAQFLAEAARVAAEHESMAVMDAVWFLVAVLADDADVDPAKTALPDGGEGSPWTRFLALVPDLVTALATQAKEAASSAARAFAKAQMKERVPHLLPVSLQAAESGDAAADAKKRAAEARRKAMMAAMAAQQQQFMAKFGAEFPDDDLDEDMPDLEQDSGSGPMPMAVDVDLDAIEPEHDPLMCLNCSQPITDANVGGYISRIEFSGLLRAQKREEVEVDPGAIPIRTIHVDDQVVKVPGLYASTCGHALHQACLDQYMYAIITRHHTQRARNHPEDTAHFEFLCPLCKNLANTLVYAPAGNCLVPPHAIRVENMVAIKERDPEEILLALAQPSHADPLGAGQGAIAHIPHKNNGLGPATDDIKPIVPHYGFPAPLVHPVMDAQFPTLATLAYTLACVEVMGRLEDAAGAACAAPAAIAQGTSWISKLPPPTTAFLRAFAHAAQWQVLAAPTDPDPFELPVTGHADPSQTENLANLTEFGAKGLDPFGLLLLWTVIPARFPTALADAYSEGDLSRTDAPQPTDTSDHRFVDLRTWRRAVRATLVLAVAQQGCEIAAVFLRKAALLYSAAVIPPRTRRGAIARDVFHARLAQHSDVATAHVHALLVDPNDTETDPSHVWSTVLRDAQVTACAHRAVVDYAGPYRLVPLPKRLEDLLKHRRGFVCTQCGTPPRDIAMCLHCGTKVCEQGFCCTVQGIGECTQHMTRCAGENALFVDMTRVSILVLFRQNGTFLPAPYLDPHGEPDLGFRRGRPMKISAAKVGELNRLWITHGTASLVARKIEASMDTGGWETL
ncbi:hypothetical protein AMAG_12581 [Allomyces macrogynus ATCC 38327]|uniref:E3 ubiquitin-protein ligase n=1 Tax=Allomyces macrogynus (strain ATCC 38327) TaxID=578462 RepID=A0A0L0SZ77_ALLM3|nr:hypothetical protein AMAG_12581 [Allomyces macrogynus ATCC 38327]|eukprot:KNE67863.1 hypothetical protein AMAG_12581 [Allomyces macrogynus ATCC 38327]